MPISESITLSEVSQRQINTIQFHFYVGSKRKINKDSNRPNKHREQTSGYQGEGGEGWAKWVKQSGKYLASSYEIYKSRG